jgi:acetamidase/formamidase
MLETWNCPIAEVVNGVKGVYCMVPKNLNTKHEDLTKADNAKFFVTYAKDADVEKAMSKAAMAMLNKLMDTKKLSRVDAYTLASFTLDCRIAPYQTGDKEVHCMLAKDLWVK